MYSHGRPYAYPYSGYLASSFNDSVISQRQEESYIENILRMNVGKVMTVYLTFENNREWNAKKITGTLRAAGRDYLLLRDRDTKRDFLFRMINVDYFEFEDLAFSPPESRTRNSR